MTENRYRVTLQHSFREDTRIISIAAQTEELAIEKALQSISSNPDDLIHWDIWGCKKIPPGGKRNGAGRPPGRTTRPIRIPIENIDKAQNLDVALDILREWKLRSSLNQKSARFYFLDQAIAELEKHWGEI